MVENDSTDGFANIPSVSSNSDTEEVMNEEHLDISDEQIKMCTDVHQTKPASNLNATKILNNLHQIKLNKTEMSNINQIKISPKRNKTKMSTDSNQTDIPETKMSSNINGTKMASNLNETELSNKQQIKCSLCEIIINSEKEFIKHTNEIHLKKLHKCNICNKYYINFSALKLHLYNHENRCKYCMKVFENITRLNHHIQMDHEQKSEYPCSICGILCKTKIILKSHKRVSVNKIYFF